MVTRLDNFLSNEGFGTRKHVKTLIKNGHVKLENEIVKIPDFKFDPELLACYVDDNRVEYQKEIFLMLNKPSGYICSNIDERYPSVLRLIDSKYLKRIKLVGRLDADTTGLLLLMDNGKISNRLIHPNTGIEKEYLAGVDKEVSDKDLEILRRKIDLYDDGIIQAKKVELVGPKLLDITVSEGKYHEIKRMCKRANLEVVKLTRLRIGELKLGDLELGQYRHLTKEEVNYIKKAVNMED